MPVTYNTIEELEDEQVPAWDYTWPGYDGCGTRRLYYIAFNAHAPTGQSQWYEPVTVNEVRDNRHMKGRRRGIPPYSMTPYYRATYTTRKYLLRRLNATNGHQVYRQFGHNSKNGGSTCVYTVDRVEVDDPKAPVWWEVSSSPTGTTYTTNGFDSNEVANARLTVMNDLSTKALTSYDALTDVAEAREIPGLVRSIASDVYHIQRTLRGRHTWRTLSDGAFQSPRNLLKSSNKALRKLGDEWMQYRYGIMPLVYSYRDVVKTIHRTQYMRDRRTIVVRPKDTGVSLPNGQTTAYQRVTYEGDIRFTGTVFQAFGWQEAAQFAGIGMNPLTTLWELIPYSFVFDWFVNVGDFITRSTSRIESKMYFACISQRSNYTKKTWQHFKNEDKSISFNQWLPVNWWGSYPPATPTRLISRPAEDQLFSEEETNAYDRQLFLLDDAQLAFNVNFNWRRGLDSAVMVLNQIRGLNRLFKGR